MTFDRRDFLLIGSAAALGAFLPGVAIAQSDEEAAAFEAAFQEVQARLRETYALWGLEELEPHPLASGDPGFNGGLRSDADPEMLRPGTFVIQPSARLSDIQERGRPDLLPLFHVSVAMLPEGADEGNQLVGTHGLITETFGLDPDRIAFASVPEAERLRDPMAAVGWDFDEKVLLRDPEEVHRLKDSSGYFYPNPNEPFYITSQGIYYRLSEAGEPSFASHPPPRDWSEIGELGIGQLPAPVIALGVERLTLATRGLYPQWQHRLTQLRAALEASGGDALRLLDDFAQ